MNKYLQNKVFAFDLDGTLVNSKKEVLDSSKEAIRLLIENGAHVVLASGRTFKGIMPIAKEFGLDKIGCYVCAFNGGLLTHSLTKEIVYDKKLTCEEALKIHDFLKKNNVTSITYYDDKIITTDEFNQYVHIEEKCNFMTAYKVDDYKDYLQDGVNKLLATDDPKIIKKIEPLVKEEFDNVEAYISADYFLEILPKGIYKSEALKFLLNALNLTPYDLFTFGDGNNDISMLDYAKNSIAMNNASDEVKSHAKYITHSCDEDGIYFAIKNIMEGKWN